MLPLTWLFFAAVGHFSVGHWLLICDSAASCLAAEYLRSGSQVGSYHWELLPSLQKLFLFLVSKSRWDFPRRVPRRGLLLAAGWGPLGIIVGAGYWGSAGRGDGLRLA